MGRIKALEIAAKEYWNERIQSKRLYLLKNETQLEIQFQEKLRELINQQITNQKENGQKQIKYLFLCRLYSSEYTGSYEMILGMSNSNLYLDDNKCLVLWQPIGVYEDIDTDMENVKKELQRTFIRLEEYEIFSLKQKLLFNEWCLIKDYFYRLAERYSDVIRDSSLQTEKELLVLSGDYMDKLSVIGQLRIGRKG